MMTKKRPEPPELVAIPRLLEGDMAAIEMILRGAGLLTYVHEAFGEDPAGLFVRRSDFERVKTLLADYQVTHPGGGRGPIPW